MLATRTMIALSAVAAAGIVLATQPSHSEQTVGVEHEKIQDRHPAFSIGSALRDALDGERATMPRPAPAVAPKDDRLVVERDCDSYTWPRIPAPCLELAGDTAGADAPRRVTVTTDASNRVSFVTPAATIVARR